MITDDQRDRGIIPDLGLRHWRGHSRRTQENLRSRLYDETGRPRHGPGLAISYDIVEDHGGSIEVQSERALGLPSSSRSREILNRRDENDGELLVLDDEISSLG